MLTKKDKELIVEFKKRLPEQIKKHLKNIIAFGSRINGKAQEDSDLDIVLLVDKKSPGLEKQCEDIAYQVMWDHDFKPIISLKIFTESHFANAVRNGFSFYKHVATEGVRV